MAERRDLTIRSPIPHSYPAAKIQSCQIGVVSAKCYGYRRINPGNVRSSKVRHVIGQERFIKTNGQLIIRLYPIDTVRVGSAQGGKILVMQPLAGVKIPQAP